MVRVALIPVFFVLMLVPFPGHLWVSLAVFVVASLTDTLDGHIARTYNQVSDFGKFKRFAINVARATLLLVEPSG